MEPKKSLSLVIVGVAILVSLFIYSTHSRPASPDADALRQKLLAIENSIPTEAGRRNFLKQSADLTKEVDTELVDLDSQIITCGPSVDGLLSGTTKAEGSCIAPETNLSSTHGMFLGGQCCSALMDTKEYHENLEKLQAYKSMPDIPLDPMHTPVEMAKMWIDYDKNTVLTPDEQKIYDEAYAVSKEKPCCCKCWHYYTNEGIAKKMIKEGQYNSKEIADYWDASDICGA